MQWFKSAMVVSSAVFVAAMAANGCSSSPKGNPDAGDSGVVHPDGGGTDGKVTNNDGSTGTCPTTDPTCEVCDTTGFSPQAQGAPIGPKAGKCPAADITAFVNACLGTQGSQTACSAWQKAEGTSNKDCLACTFTQQTAAQWGVLDCGSTNCSLNVPGCLDLALGQVSQENTTSTGSCGDLLSASYGCQDAACSSCSTTDFSTCSTNAVAAECKSYADAFQKGAPCQILNGDTVPAEVSTCFPAGTAGYTDTELTNFTNFFCGQ